MKLLNSSKVVLFIILFLLSVFNIQAEEEVDIWKKNKQTQPSKPDVEKKLNDSDVYKANLKKNLNQQVQIQEEKFEEFEQAKLYGLYDPGENDFTINMWGNTGAEEFTSIIKRINKLKLSRSAEEIFIKTIFSNSYKPEKLSEEMFANIKINWLIDNNKEDLIEEFLKLNGEFVSKGRLIQYLVDRNIAKANIPDACKKVSFIDVKIKDPYLEKFKIYCLVFANKRNEAQLQYDLLKEQKLSNEFFDDKINYLLGLKEKDSGKVLDNNLLNFYLSSITVENFNYEPNDKTKKTIWDYLNASNLIKVENTEDVQKIIDLEKAANENKFDKNQIFEIYKQFKFDLNTLITANSAYRSLSGLESRALIYQKYLLAENIPSQLSYLFLLKDLFKKDKLSNVYSKFLSDKLENIKTKDIPEEFRDTVAKNIVKEKEYQEGKIKFNDKVLHRSKVLKYFIEDDYSKSKAAKDLKVVYKKIKKNKNYFFSAKDLAIVESLKKDGVKVTEDINFKKFAERYSVPKNLVDLANKNQKGFLALKIVEIIGEDDVKNLDSETIYFITNLLNQVNLSQFRNTIIASALPLRV